MLFVRENASFVFSVFLPVQTQYNYVETKPHILLLWSSTGTTQNALNLVGQTSIIKTNNNQGSKNLITFVLSNALVFSPVLCMGKLKHQTGGGLV